MTSPVLRICTPLYREYGEHPQMLRAVLDMVDAHPSWSYVTCNGANLWRNRNLMIDLAAKDWTHVLCLDSDVELGPRTVEAMVELDLPIVGAAYQERRDGGERVWCARALNHGLLPMDGPKGVGAVCWVGAGCLLVRRDVFERMPRPWFRHDFIVDDDCVSEDVGFCLHAARCGQIVHLDTRHPATHHIN